MCLHIAAGVRSGSQLGLVRADHHRQRFFLRIRVIGKGDRRLTAEETKDLDSVNPLDGDHS